MEADLPFKVAGEAVEGIMFLNDVIDEEITRKVIVNAVKQILVNGPGEEQKNISRQFIM